MTSAHPVTQPRTKNALRAAASVWVIAVESFVLCAFDSAQSRIFDRILGVSTRGGFITETSNVVDGGDNCAYSGCQWLPVRRALKDLAPTPSDVFVDLGSGKGMALLVAGRLPYRWVVGVEIDEKLSRYARHNVRLARRRLRAGRVDSVTASVLDWPFSDDTSIVFMFNPFIGQTFRAAVHRVFDSYDRRPRDLHIVYGYPWEHDWLVSTGRVIVESVRPRTFPPRLRWWPSADVIVSYRVVEASEGNPVAPVPDRTIRPQHWRLGRARPYCAVQRWSGPNDHRFALHTAGKTVYSYPES